MSRYLLLFLLNIPFVIAGLLNATVGYKTRRISKRRYIANIFFWGIVLCGLILAYPIYNYLFTMELTKTEPLSLFDVVQITAIIGVLYLATRTRGKLDMLERRVNDLHQELSILVSGLNSKTDISINQKHKK